MEIVSISLFSKVMESTLESFVMLDNVVNLSRYHSEYGWNTALEMLVEHYGIEVDRSAITIFVCIVPVITDTFVKLWVCASFQ